MEDYTSDYAHWTNSERIRYADEVLQDDESILHIVVSHDDSNGVEIPSWLIFRDEEEFQSWVWLYNTGGRHVWTVHTHNPIYV